MSFKHATRELRAALILPLLGALGCGGSSPVAPTSGVVMIDGQPYPGGKVVLSPIASAGETVAGKAALGRPNEQGRFTLTTFNDGDGALIGQHTVTLFRDGDHEAIRPDLKGLKFEMVSPASGPVTITAGENNLDLSFTSDEIRQRGNRL